MHKIGFVLFPGVSTMCLATLSVFEMANWQLGRLGYELTLISESGGLVTTSVGGKMHTSAFRSNKFDTVIVAGEHTPRSATPGLVRYIQSVYQRGTRVASVCTGAFVLAQAGVLDGRQATTHWNHAESFRRQFPQIRLKIDRIFTDDRGVWTSAGMSAGIDLALAFVEKDFGREIARATAQLMVVYHRRAGGQSQYSALLDLDVPSDRLQDALTYAKKNLHKRLSVEDLANVAFLSPRQFSRLLTKETGRSPAKAIEQLRAEAAKQMMDSGRFSAGEIARKSGYGNRDRMRRSFARVFGKAPQSFQKMTERLRPIS